MNAREWWLIVLGVLGAVVNGSIFPLFAIFFGEILEVFGLPAEEVFGEIHLWAGLFILLGVVSGISQFSKVGQCCHIYFSLLHLLQWSPSFVDTLGT